MDTVTTLVRPEYLRIRGYDERKATGGDKSNYGRYGRPYGGGGNAPQPAYAAAPQPAYAAAPQPAYAAVPQPTYVAAPQPAYAVVPQPTYAAPPGFQLVPCASGGPPPTAPGQRKVSVGKSQQDPTKTYRTAHYVKPCVYCGSTYHGGDHCWKTYPELRALNM